MRRYLLLALAFGLIVAVRYFEDGSTSTPTERGPSGVTDTRAPADDARANSPRPASHPFRLKYNLFEAGHWPLAVIGDRLDLF